HASSASPHEPEAGKKLATPPEPEAEKKSTASGVRDSGAPPVVLLNPGAADQASRQGQDAAKGDPGNAERTAAKEEKDALKAEGRTPGKRERAAAPEGAPTDDMSM